MSPENRETKKFKTPNGVEVEIYTYLTGREQRDLEAVLINEMMGEVNIETGKPSMNANLGDAQKKQEDKLIEIMILSVGGSDKDILDKILNMRSDDYKEIIKQLNATGLPKKKEI